MNQVCFSSARLSTVVTLISTAIICLALSAHAQMSNEPSAYGAYGHYPIGSTRVLAMGGAFVGLADDASAVITNPAGLSLARYTVDFSSGSNRVVNREFYFGDNTEEREGLPYTSQFRALSVRWGILGLGISYSHPYALDYDGGGALDTHRILNLESYEAAVSLALFKMVSFGVTVHSERALVGYTNPDGTKIESRKEMVYPTAGILIHMDRAASVGVTYSPERRYDIDETLDSQTAPLPGMQEEWFHDVVIPAKLTLGLSIKQGQKLRLVGDVDVYQPVKGAILVGASTNDSERRILNKTQAVIHGGFEFAVQSTKELDFMWRGGGYSEPKRIEGVSDRFHFTMGVEVRYLFLVLAASYDQAPGFSNVAQSVGISLGEL